MNVRLSPALLHQHTRPEADASGLFYFAPGRPLALHENNVSTVSRGAMASTKTTFPRFCGLQQFARKGPRAHFVEFVVWVKIVISPESLRHGPFRGKRCMAENRDFVAIVGKPRKCVKMCRGHTTQRPLCQAPKMCQNASRPEKCAQKAALSPRRGPWYHRAIKNNGPPRPQERMVL